MESEEENKGDTLETKKNSAVLTKREEITGKVGKRNKEERPSKVTELQKNRAKNVESILDFYGRKRERPEEEEEEKEKRATVKRCNSAADQLSPAEKERRNKDPEKQHGFCKIRNYDKCETDDNNAGKEHEHERRYKRGDKTIKTEYRSKKGNRQEKNRRNR